MNILFSHLVDSLSIEFQVEYKFSSACIRHFSFKFYVLLVFLWGSFLLLIPLEISACLSGVLIFNDNVSCVNVSPLFYWTFSEHFEMETHIFQKREHF